MIQSYKDLQVWQKALDMADAIFAMSESFQKEQRYVICSQIERCAASVPANIAEGRMRHSRKDFIYHLSIAKGSLAELETFLYLSQRRSYILEEKLNSFLLRTAEIMKMLHGLKASLMEPKVESAKTQNLKLKPIT